MIILYFNVGKGTNYRRCRHVVGGKQMIEVLGEDMLGAHQWNATPNNTRGLPTCEQLVMAAFLAVVKQPSKVESTEDEMHQYIDLGHLS